MTSFESLVITCLLIPAYLAAIIYVRIVQGEYLAQYIVEMLLVIAVLGSFLASTLHAQQAPWRETRVRLLSVYAALKSANFRINLASAGKIPELPTVSVSMVLRDGGVRRSVPSILVVKGDTVLLRYGDRAPCDLSLIGLWHPTSGLCPLNQTCHELSEGRYLHSSFRPEGVEERNESWMFAYKASTTNLSRLLDSATKKHNRPLPISHHQLARLKHVVKIWVSSLVLVTAIGNSISYALEPDILPLEKVFLNSVFPALASSWIPILVLKRVLETWGTATIHALWEALLKSPEVYEEDSSVDAFDVEAPSPTKHVVLRTRIVLDKFWKMWWSKEGLSLQTQVLEGLATISTFCVIDKEGTVCSPIPTPEEICLFPPDADDVVLDVTQRTGTMGQVVFEDKDWQAQLPSLRPIGLHHILRAGRPKPQFVKLFPSRQMGHHGLSKAIGFVPSVRQMYKPLREIFAIDVDAPQHYDGLDLEVPNLFATLYSESKSGSQQLLCEGHASILLSRCAQVWDGTHLRPLTEKVSRRAYEYYRNITFNGGQCVCYAYKPVLADKLGPTGDQMFLQVTDPLLQNLILLGMVAFEYQPKPDFQEVIEDIGLGGTRFVLFSPQRERPTKVLGEKMGLETDWNCCIILSDEDHPPVHRQEPSRSEYVELHDIKARLPVGISKIKEHLRTVDDIPLQVSLFAESTPGSASEMVQILQSYGEVVCCCGSVLNETYVDSYALADVSVAIEPIKMGPTTVTSATLGTKGSGGSVSLLEVATQIIRLPCALVLPYEASMYAFTQSTREARTYYVNGIQAFAFLVGVGWTVSLVFALSSVVTIALPGVSTVNILSGYQLLWLIIVMAPLIATGIVVGIDKDGAIMKQFMVKNASPLEDLRRLLWYAVARFSVPTITTIAVFFLAEHLEDVGDQKRLLPVAQDFALISLVSHFLIMSFTFWDRTIPLHQCFCQTTGILFLTVILTITFQALFSLTHHMLVQTSPPKRWWLYVILTGSWVMTVGVNEVVKSRDRKQWTRFQRRSKLEFNTKLGQHSPL